MGLKWKYTEGQTKINEEESDGLLIKSIALQSELDEWEQYNIEKALEWTVHLKTDAKTLLSEKFIKTLHKKMYGEVWKWAGTFRKSNKNIGVNWTNISIELKKLLDDTIFWVENKSYEPEELAIRFKHRLVSIHCFPNGNGRHSRIMADLIMEKVYKQNPFPWHYSNKKSGDQIRKLYINALKKADNGQINPLIEFACYKEL